MRGQIEFNGWRLQKGNKLSSGLYSNLYLNRDGWTAREIRSGKKNLILGLEVSDENGHIIGMVKNVAELP